MSAPLTLLALLIEPLIGYPERVSRAIGHPVTWMGRLISILEERLNTGADAETRRRWGAVALLVLLVTVGAAAFFIEVALLLLPFGMLALAIVASTLLAQRSLFVHVARVADALDDEGLEAGRKAVAHIVGRDTSELDQAGVARAAIESLGENFSDGVVAPAFWMVLAGLPGAALYKAINTADSMIGHRSERYRDFGQTAAQLDDLVNYPASRLSALLISAGAFFTKGASPSGAWTAMRRDAKRHASPNAGYPEAALAGALGLSLGGPRSYDGAPTEGAYMGDGRREATAADIRAALELYARADGLLIAVVLVLAALTALV
ncbi:MAG: adenosylcobinamide-phosphate synthase CbiB [Methyloceanibacter sp.]